MIERYEKARRARRRLLMTAASSVAVLAGLTLLPNDTMPASALRFGLSAATCAAGIAIVALLTRAWTRWREARLRLLYAGAPASLNAGLDFLIDEHRAATAGMRPAILTAMSAGSLWLLSAWPQLIVLSPLRPIFAAGTIVGLGMAAILPVLNRRHAINAIFLRSYLRQSSRHVGFLPWTMRRAYRLIAELAGPAVTVCADGIRAGGFDWQWEDFTKSVLVAGQPGSGKTIAVLNTLLETAFLAGQQQGGRMSALVVDVKGDYLGKVERLCARLGRSEDLLIFDIQAKPALAGTLRALRINPVHNDFPPMEVASLLMEVKKHEGMRANESFFHSLTRNTLAYGITLLRAGLPAGEVASVEHLYRIAVEKPQREHVTEDSEIVLLGPLALYDELCARIVARWPDRRDLPPSLSKAIKFFETEFFPMPDRQLAGVVGTVSELVTELMSEPVAAFVNGPTTVSMQDILDRGLILYVHAPLAHNPRLGKLVNTLIKMQFQLAVRRSLRKENPSLFFCDEFHNLFSAGEGGDAQFFSLSRESRHSNIVSFQALPLLYEVAKSKEEVHSLLANCATKFFLRNTDPETNEFASRLFGETSTINVSQSEAARFGAFWRRSHTSYSRSAGKARVIPPDTFTQLAVPTRDDPRRHFAESIVHLGTRARTECLRLFWKVHEL